MYYIKMFVLSLLYLFFVTLRRLLCSSLEGEGFCLSNLISAIYTKSP